MKSFTNCNYVYGFHLLLGVLLASFLAGCAVFQPPDSTCDLTVPTWIIPPDDPAVSGSPEHGYYYVNDDRSIWASAWWYGEEEITLKAGEQGVKVGWFRPAGAELEIVGMRIDGVAPPLESHVPCCYPTRFQAAGLSFPTAGCWEVIGTADGKTLTFTVSVTP